MFLSKLSYFNLFIQNKIIPKFKILRFLNTSIFTFLHAFNVLLHDFFRKKKNKCKNGFLFSTFRTHSEKTTGVIFLIVGANG